jgi:cell division protein FtsI (penicillin-binding protein 3)
MGGKRPFDFRMAIVVGFMFILAGAVVIRLMFVQIVDAEKYRDKAKRQYERKLTLEARRGAIYDRHMNRLATSLAMMSVAADPKMVENKSAVADSLAKFFDKNAAYYRKKLQKRTRFVWLERNVPMDKAIGFRDWRPEGIIKIKDQSRYYENLGSHVIGFTNSDNVGISGLELQYNDFLEGENGLVVMQRDAIGKIYPAIDKPLQEPVHGKQVQLTMDLDIQAIVENELSLGVKKANAAEGIAIVMDVNTGELLSVANMPDFDMNNKATYRSDRVRNRAITDIYEPGSTFKLIMLSSAIKEGLIKPEDEVFAENGKYKIHGRWVSDHEELGKTTFLEALAHSSNIVAAKVAMNTGKEPFYDMAKAYGFGQQTGVGLLGEQSGYLKPKSEWSKITLPWMAQGYEVLVTPIQLISAYAAVANGGMLMKPYLVKATYDEDGSLLDQKEPKAVRRVLDEDDAKVVCKVLKAVVDSGTGINAQIKGLSVAGKTGTAQRYLNGSYRRGGYVSSFVGFFPVEKPELALLVMMINPKNGYYGSEVAAPVFSRIGSRIMAVSRKYRESIYESQSMADVIEQVQEEEMVSVPNICGLEKHEAKEVLRAHFLDYKQVGQGSGIVINQMPEPGSAIKRFSKISYEVTKDQDRVMMPDFKGLRADKAVRLVEDLSLKLKINGSGSYVTAQYPDVGSRLKRQSKIILRMD